MHASESRVEELFNTLSTAEEREQAGRANLGFLHHARIAHACMHPTIYLLTTHTYTCTPTTYAHPHLTLPGAHERNSKPPFISGACVPCHAYWLLHVLTHPSHYTHGHTYVYGDCKDNWRYTYTYSWILIKQNSLYLWKWKWEGKCRL